jgi:hypothetical protein
VNSYSLIFSTLILTHTLFGYEDSDIDGVDDAIDLCPDTPFDKLVDEDGCPEDKHYWGAFTLQLGNDISLDEEHNLIKNYSFFGNYNYKKWNFSLSNSQLTTYDGNDNASSSRGDIYLNLGYEIDNTYLQSNLSFGTKIATADENIGTGENDYFVTLNLSHVTDKQVILFSQFGYTLTGDSPLIEYQNSFAYTLGTGYFILPHWYSALSYDYAQSIYSSTPNYQSLSWMNSYTFLDDYYLSLNYTYGLDNISYPHTLSLKLGVTFE